MTARVMAFVDGENLLLRYEAMRKDHTVRGPDHRHYAITGAASYVQDRYVWSRWTVNDLVLDDRLVRAHYYTTFDGAPQDLEPLKADIARLEAHGYREGFAGGHSVRLLPRIFPKPGRGVRTKSVDINLCVEVLEYVRNDALDAVYLISGDGDYRPLLEAVMRAGKRAYLAAFSNGLNETIKSVPDKFIDLDQVYFAGKQAS